MRKRLLACILTLCLIIGMVTVLGLGASAADVVAEVTVGETAEPMLSLKDAINAAVVTKGGTVKLLTDMELGAMALDGDYTLDLNGKKITVTEPLTVSVGLVTITDSSEEGTGIITADKCTAIMLTGGSLVVNGGTIHSKETFAIQNCDRGLLCLSGAPAITTESKSAIYVGYPNTLYGIYDKAPYTGKNLQISCGFNMVDNAVVAKNATAAQFTPTNYDEDHFTILEQDGNLVVAQLAVSLWFVIGALAVITVSVVIFTISHTVQFKRSMKFYSFSFPALLSALLLIPQTQTLAMLAAAAACVIAVIACVAVTSSQNKSLKAAREAKLAADAAAKAEAEAAKAAEEAAKAEAAQAVEAAPVEEAPAEEPVEEAAAEEAPAEEPVEEAVAEEAPAEEPVEEAVAEEAPAEEPVEEAAAEEAPAEEPVEEAAAEEAPAEEPVEEAAAEEAPTEEAAEEEAAEEADEETLEEPVAEDEADEPAAAPVVATPPKAKPDRIVIAETDANGNVIYSAYKKSFTARVIQSPEDVQERYETLKNALLSYKKVNSRVSWSYDSFKSGRKQLAKFAIRGKSLCLFLAIDPTTLEDSKYNVANAGTSKKYETVPCRLRLSSKRSIKWGLELIAKLAEQEGLEPNPKFKPKSWRMENETTESLLEKGLIKKIV